MFKMKKEPTNNRFSVINKIVFFSFLLVVVSCEELTESLNPRDNIIDTWKCLETDASRGTDSFLVEIEEDAANASGIEIYNFNHLGDNFVVEATVSGYSISIPSQEVDGFTIRGNGTIDTGYDEITLSYSVDDGGGRENYTAVLTKP